MINIDKIMDSYGRLKWKSYFMVMCFLVSQKSIDPSTKHGCVVTDEDNTVLSIGFNSGPRNCDESKIELSRPEKYDWIIHAEANAIINASRSGTSLYNSIFYITGKPCVECLKKIINCGAKKIIYGPIYCVDSNIYQKFDDIIDSFYGTLEIEEFGNFDEIKFVLNKILQYCDSIEDRMK